MPGVYRPYTVVDVIASLSGQNQAPDTSETLTGAVAEAEETMALSETVDQPASAWNGDLWGGFSWT